MCVLIVKPAGVPMPPKGILMRCAARNPHGFGFATKDVLFKSLDFEEFYRELSKVNIGDACIIHFRYATHGSIKQENCHPFYNYSARIAFAHNGMIHEIEPYMDMTDSETAFQFYFVPKIKRYGLYSKGLSRAVNKVLGSNKFAFIDSNGNLRTFGRYIEHKGCFYSNMYFMNFLSHNSFLS